MSTKDLHLHIMVQYNRPMSVESIVLNIKVLLLFNIFFRSTLNFKILVSFCISHGNIFIYLQPVKVFSPNKCIGYCKSIFIVILYYYYFLNRCGFCPQVLDIQN